MRKIDFEIYKELKRQYGKKLSKFYRVRRNYPFGKKSQVVLTFERKKGGKKW